MALRSAVFDTALARVRAHRRELRADLYAIDRERTAEAASHAASIAVRTTIIDRTVRDVLMSWAFGHVDAEEGARELASLLPS